MKEEEGRKEGREINERRKMKEDEGIKEGGKEDEGRGRKEGRKEDMTGRTKGRKVR